jgi:hypothetical protein
MLFWWVYLSSSMVYDHCELNNQLKVYCSFMEIYIVKITLFDEFNYSSADVDNFPVLWKSN